MFCSNCGSKLDDDSLFCTKCGLKLSDNKQLNYCSYCGEKIENESQFCIKCGKKIESVSNDVIKYEQANQKHKCNSSSKTRKTILILSIIFCLISFGLVGFSYYFFKTSQNEIYDWMNKYREQTGKKQQLEKDIKKLQSDYNNLQSSYNQLMDSNCGVFIEIKRFYNRANQTEKLDHSNLTYLMIEYKINKSDDINDDKKIFLKIYDSKWQLMQGSSSPYGYTTSVEFNSENIGWGSVNPGVYQTGIYTVEFWFDNMCLCRKKVWIY